MAEKHKEEFSDVPTFIYSYDTIFDPKFLMTNYRDLNGTVKVDKDNTTITVLINTIDEVYDYLNNYLMEYFHYDYVSFATRKNNISLYEFCHSLYYQL